LALVVLGAFGLSLLSIELGKPPYEDAAMLLRYAKHVADGHGFVWNVGERPVDGATDIGLVFLVAAVSKLGVGVVEAARVVALCGFVAIVALSYVFARAYHHCSRWGAAVLAGFVATGTGIAYVDAGFGTTVFGLAVLGCSMLAVIVRDRPHDARLAFLFGAAVVLAGIVRPEGFLVGACLAAGVLVACGRQALSSVLRAGIAAFVGAVAFVAARWYEFGYPLPNPYYKKGGGTLHVEAMLSGVWTIVQMTWPLLLIVVFALALRNERRKALGLLTTVALFACLWVAISDEMNFAGRFQYAALMILVAGVPGLAHALWGSWQARDVERQGAELLRPVAVAMAVVALLGLAARALDHASPGYRGTFSRSGIMGSIAFGLDSESYWSRSLQWEVARVLARFPPRGRVVATSEAGIVPLYSGWPALDAWGLNDETIAHQGVISSRRLAATKPAIVFIHAPTTPLAKYVNQGQEKFDPFLPGWTRMTNVVIRYCEGGDYVLAASLVGQTRTTASWSVYVRPGMPDTERLVREFRAMDSGGRENLAVVSPHLPVDARPDALR